MNWLRSMAELARDIAATLVLEVGALVEDWRAER